MTVSSMGKKIPLNQTCRDEAEERIISVLNDDPHFRHENNRNLPIAAFPKIMSEATYNTVTAAATKIYSILERIVTSLCNGRLTDSRFMHHGQFAALNAATRRHGRHLFLARFDYLMQADGSFKFIEFNTSCPAGMAFFHKWREVVAKHAIGGQVPLNRRFPLDERTHFAKLVLDLAKAHYHVQDVPHVVIANDNAGLTLELSLLASCFRELGATAAVCNLEDLSYDGQFLYDKGQKRVDAVYCKIRPTPSVILGWSEAILAKYKAFVDACLDDQVCVVNPFPAMTIGEDKALLACMHLPEYRHMMTQDERAVVDRFIPETWFIDPRDTRQIDRFIAERERLILKPRMEGRGQLIVAGRDVSHVAWRQLIMDSTEWQWVMQEFLPSEPVVEATTGNVYSETMALFMIDGVPSGTFSRISTETVNNVGASGKICATFIE